jgi:hypothetical protein
MPYSIFLDHIDPILEHGKSFSPSWVVSTARAINGKPITF